ncbi:MAG: PEP-CTERM system TPR-repeat protein PrsT [Rubrivivax sp.]|nr:PEP-CTERM system TPR-repeat protein PrsT [Rubrivivax sp.]
MRRALQLAALCAALAACRGPAADQQLASAQQRLERGEYAASAIDARNLLKDQPESAPARLLLARALWGLGDLHGTEAELDRAERFGIPPAELVRDRARLWLAMKQPQRVVQLLQAAAPSPAAPASAAAERHVLLAQARQDLGDAAAAGAELDKALALEPAHLPAQVLRLRLLAERGDFAAALAGARALTGQHPGQAQAWQLQADLLARPGADRATRAPEAVAAYRKVLQLEARQPQAHAALVTLHLAQRDFVAARAQVGELRKLAPALPLADYLEGLGAFLGGDLAQARERTQTLLKTTEPQPQVLLLAGMTEARLAAPAQAEAHLSAAVSAAPGWTLPRRELAALQLRQGRAERALATLAPLLGPDEAASRAEPAVYAELWVLAGQAHARRADFRAADQAFARAKALQPADPALRAAAARLDLARGQAEHGLRELQAAAASDTDSVGADLALISALVQRGQRDAALKALAAATAKQPSLALLPYLRGRIIESDGTDTAGPADRRAAARAAGQAEARQAYEQALRLDARFKPAVDALAALDLAQGQAEAARKRYEALLKLDPPAATAWLALAELALRSGAPVAEVVGLVDRSVRADPKDAHNWRAAIDLQRRLGDPAATLSRAQAATAALPDDGDLMLALADAQQFGGEAMQSLATLNRLAQLRPQSAEVQLRLALAQGLAGQNAAARGPLAKAAELAPEAPEVLRASIALALAERQPDRALALARGQQQRQPRQALGWLLEAEVEAAQGHHEAAAKAWRAAYAREGTAGNAVALHRGLMAADAAAAATFAQQRLVAAPDDALFLAHLAEQAVRAGRPDQAEARYRAALRIQPDHVLVLNNLAEILTQRGDPEGLALARRAAQLQPHFSAVLDTLAAAHAAQRQTAEAVRVQSRAVELQPGEPLLRLRLAKYLLAGGDKDRAAAELRRVAQAPGPAALRDEAAQLLKKAGG